MLIWMPTCIKIPYTVKPYKSQQRFLCVAFPLKHVIYEILYREYNAINSVEWLSNIRAYKL